MKEKKGIRPKKKKQWNVSVQAVTDAGYERIVNEDNLSLNGTVHCNAEMNHFVFSSENDLDDENAFYLVADGMGGQDAGDVASLILVETAGEYSRLLKQCDIYDEKKCKTILNEMLERTKQKISETFDECGKICGATATAILFGEGRAHLVNIGDSPAFRFREPKWGKKPALEELYADQSQAGVLVKKKLMSPEEAACSHKRHKLTAYVGSGDCNVSESAHHNHFEIEKGDYLIIASDGLTEELSKEEIINVVSKTKKDQIVSQLFDCVMNKGASDNITIIGIDIT